MTLPNYIVIDLEATGVKPSTDRIVQVGIAGAFEMSMLINPGIPIPPESTEVHGITDEMVASQPTFAEVAQVLHQKLSGCRDLVGFNHASFDIPMLWEEFYRCGIEWDLAGVNIIDVGNLFKKREPRTLGAAVEFYCGRKMENAHDALEDAIATSDVYIAMLSRYPDLRDMPHDKLAEESQYEKRIDLAGVVVVGKDGRPTFNIGNAKGSAVEDNPGFAKWVLSKDFSENTKRVIDKILNPPAVGLVESMGELPF